MESSKPTSPQALPPPRRIAVSVSSSLRCSLDLENMDINDIKNTVSNLTLYDLKAGFRKAQNGSYTISLFP